MSILFADDFKGYGNVTDYMLNGLYAENSHCNLSEDPDPNADGYVFCAIIDAVAHTRLRRVLPATITTAGMAFRLWMNTLPGQDSKTLSIGFADAGNNMQASMCVDTTGRIVIREGTFGTIIGTTTNPVLTANAWSHIEVKFVASTTVGTIEVRVNGVPVLTCMGVNSGTGYAQWRIDLGTDSNSSHSWYFKDLVTWSGTGGHNTNFLGTVTVVGLIPNSDVSLGWTPNVGVDGYPLLDNSPPVDATDYIAAEYPPPPPSTFGMSNLPVNVSSVRALITQVRARKVDGGDGNLQASLISSGDTADGADRPITTAFTYYEDVFEVDPHTAAPWTPGAVDAANLKLNRTV